MIIAVWSIALLLLAAWSALAWIFYAKASEPFDPGSTSWLSSFLRDFFAAADGLLHFLIIATWLGGVVLILLHATVVVFGVIWWRRRQLKKAQLNKP